MIIGILLNARDLIYRMHARWFNISEDKFHAIQKYFSGSDSKKIASKSTLAQ